MTKIRINNLPDKKAIVKEILVAPGEFIAENCPIVLIECNNKTMPIISPISGKIKKIYLKVNKKIKVNKKVAKINENDFKEKIVSEFNDNWVGINDPNYEEKVYDVKESAIEKKIMVEDEKSNQVIVKNTADKNIVDDKVSEIVSELKEKVNGVSKFRQKIEAKVGPLKPVKKSGGNLDNIKNNDTVKNESLTLRQIVNQRTNAINVKNNNFESKIQENKIELPINKSKELEKSKKKSLGQDVAIGNPRPISYAERVFARAREFEKEQAAKKMKKLLLSQSILNRVDSLHKSTNEKDNYLEDNSQINSQTKEFNNHQTEQIPNNQIQNNQMQTNQMQTNQMQTDLSIQNNPLLQNQMLLQQQLLTNPLLQQQLQLINLYPQILAQQQLQQQLMTQVPYLNPVFSLLSNPYLLNLQNLNNQILQNNNSLLSNQNLNQNLNQTSNIYQVHQENPSQQDIEKVLKKLNEQNKINSFNTVRNVQECMQQRTMSLSSLTTEIDLTSILKLRERLMLDISFKNVRLNYIIFIIKSISLILNQYPQINSVFDKFSNKFLIKKYHNIALATLTGDEQKNPVIYSVDQLSLKQLSNNLEITIKRVKSNQSDPSDFENSTISVVNFGLNRVLSGMAPVQYGHAAAISIGKIEKRPIVIGDKLVIRHLCYVSITVDQRVINSDLAGMFLGALKDMIENPNINLFV